MKNRIALLLAVLLAFACVSFAEEIIPELESEVLEAEGLTFEADIEEAAPESATDEIVIEDEAPELYDRLVINAYASIGKGESISIKDIIEAPEGTEWYSDAEEIFTVSKNTSIKGVKTGEAYLRSTDNALCVKVTVLKAPTSFELNYTKRTMSLSEKLTLEPEFNTDEYARVKFTSSNKSIAKVGSYTGIVTPVKTGTVTITATAFNKKTATCKITVKKAATAIAVSPATLTLGKGQTAKVTCKATKPSSAYANATWTSSKPSIVAVDEETGELMAKNVGDATITCVTLDGKLTATAEVKVVAAPREIVLPAPFEISVGMTQTIQPIVYDTNGNDATEFYAPMLQYESSSSKYVKVDDSGKITAVKQRSSGTSIKVYFEDDLWEEVDASCSVFVVAPPKAIKVKPSKCVLVPQDTYQLTYTLTPEVQDEDTAEDYQVPAKVSFSTSNKKVAKVSSSGKITAVAAGTAVITAKTHNGKTSTCKVTVLPLPTKIAISAKRTRIAVGEELPLTVTLTPSNAYNLITFTSSNENVVYVEDGVIITGEVEAESDVTITAETINGKKATLMFTVVPEPTEVVLDRYDGKLKVGKSAYIHVLSDGACTFKSSNTKIATVGSTSGKVTGKKAGTCVITVTCYNGLTAQCTVKVTK